MIDRSAIFACKTFFNLPDADEEAITGEAGRKLLWEIWQEHGDDLYENPLNVLRQEWWHAYEAPGRLDAPPGFWLTIPADGKLLDYGCGTAELDRRLWIERDGWTVLVDKSKAVRDYLNFKYFNFIRNGSVSVHGQYEATAHEFDAIVCTDVFEHVKSPRRLLIELWKTLKPGGQFLTNFSCSYPHAGHLQESIAQQPAWWQYLKEHSQIIVEDGYIWAIKLSQTQ